MYLPLSIIFTVEGMEANRLQMQIPTTYVYTILYTVQSDLPSFKAWIQKSTLPQHNPLIFPSVSLRKIIQSCFHYCSSQQAAVENIHTHTPHTNIFIKIHFQSFLPSSKLGTCMTEDASIWAGPGLGRQPLPHVSLSTHNNFWLLTPPPLKGNAFFACLWRCGNPSDLL